MIPRRNVFPNVIEMNYQARQRLGCCVYLIYDESQWLLIDIGFEDTVDEIIEMIRQMDFPLANCRYLVATHADVDHIQGFERAKQLMPQATVVGHEECRRIMAEGDRVATYAEIAEQGVSINLPQIEIERVVDESDTLAIGGLELNVWHTPGHTRSQLCFQMGDLLFSGDNIYRDGGVGNIDAHHGSDIPAFIRSLERIRDSDVAWLLPSHGPIFRKDKTLLQSAIDRLRGYLHLSDFGTCAVDWPLLEEWDQELARGFQADSD